MKNIQLMALDLDGTTLNPEGELSPETKEALEAAGKEGIEIVIATGRCYEALPESVKAVEGLRYAINSNGAQMTDMKNQEVFYENIIDQKAIPIIKERIQDCGHFIEIFIKGKAYVDPDKYQQVKDGIISYRRKEYVLATRRPQPHLMDFMMDHQDEIENINIFFDTPEAKAQMYHQLETIPNVTLTSSIDSNWEIGGNTTGKGTALAYLCQKKGISLKNVMACGDNPNDISMLEKVGYAVAMGNAKEEVKAMADYITDTNEENGVAKMVKKVLAEKSGKSL